MSAGNALAVVLALSAGLAGSVQAAVMGKLGQRIGIFEAIAFSAFVAVVVARSEGCVRALAALGCRIEAPFQALAFLALSVIPSLKLTDQGLVDVDRFRLVPLAAD